MSNSTGEPLRIKLNKEQSLKFLSFFVDDAIRIANERKREQIQKKEKEKDSQVV